MQTYIINLVGGPGLGKTTMAALIFAKLKQRHHITEYVQEYAKHLVWTKQYDILNNQYQVTQTQFNLLSTIDGAVEFIVTDGPIIQGLYYNLYNRDNNSNVEKTEKYILDSSSKFKNINIFFRRGNFEYETAGRLQTKEEAIEIDGIMKQLFEQHSIPCVFFDADASDANLDTIIDFIIAQAHRE